ncbi:MAG: hypothetical protein WC254_04195 [Candidatus Woesearchaeota archaeon]|jgi:hypothetical protein
MKNKLIFITLIMMLISSCSWFGEQEISVPAGITADSIEYEQYGSCVTECNQCEVNCLDEIYYTKAITGENKDTCDSITSPTLQQECKYMLLATEAVSELNKDKCLMLIEDQQENCLVHVSAEIALQSQSIDKCAESPDVVRCQNIYYMDVAVTENNTTYCDNLSEEKKEICYTIVQE